MAAMISIRLVNAAMAAAALHASSWSRLLLMRIDRVLRDQRRIVAELLGREHQIAIAFP